MQAPSSSTLTFLALLPLIAWRIYARFRKMIGRQRLSRVRPWITLAIYSLLVVLVAVSTFKHAGHLWWLAASLLLGVGLSIVGLRFTKFEAVRGVGLFYTPNAHLGLALSALFVARIGYRIFEVYIFAPALPRSSTEFMGSSASVLAFGLLAGYYLGYAVGLARWRAAVFRAKGQREEATTDA